MVFRALRARVGLLSSSRLPVRYNTHRQQFPQPTIQRVRLHKKGRSLTYIIGSAVGCIALINVYKWIVFAPLDNIAAELEQNLDEKELEEIEQPLFLPFPFTTKQLPTRPYRGTDPEWQEFVRFSQDREAFKSIRRELADFVKQCADRNPNLVAKCGSDIAVKRYWLDIDFPLAPPPEFERSGLSIGDDYITVTKQPVDSLTVYRIRQALWPSPLTQSFYKFFKTLITEDARHIAERLGLQEPKGQSSFDILLGQRFPKPGNNPSGAGTMSKEGTIKSSQAFGNKQAIPNGASSERAASNDKAESEVEDDKEAIGKINAQVHGFAQHWVAPINAFRKTFTQTWRHAPSYPPRGSVLVSGLIELESSKAWIVIDVKAAYDPKTKTYDGRYLSFALRRLQMKRQAPLGE